MIDLKINHSMASVQLLGSTSDITTETLLGIKGIYEGLKERNPECAEIYKEMILKTINTAFLTTEEVHDLAKEEMNSLFDNLLKSVRGELMAYRKLYKWFSQFRKLPFTDWVYWYKEYVLKTPEQRESERIESKNRARQTLAQLGIISSVVNNMSEYGR